MKKLYALLSALFVYFISFNCTAQVSTNGGSGLLPAYGSLAGAISDLNAATITTNVVITVENNETAPIGGYVINATGTPGVTITIDGAGYTLTAATTTAGNMNDAVIKVVGGDYITIENFTIQENAANTVTTAGATNTMTEFGIALYGASISNGAQNNTIQNNTVALSGTYATSFGILSTCTFIPGSSAAGITPAPQLANVLGGANSNNKYYGNNISNVAYGMMIVASPATASFRQTGDDIGGTALGTGNTISYSSTATPAVLYQNAPALAAGVYGGIIVTNALGANIRYNTVNTAANLTVSTTGIILGFTTSTPLGFTFTNTVSDNIISVGSGATTGNLYGIEFGYGLNTGGFAGTLTAANNSITLNQATLTAASSAAVTGIRTPYAALAVNVTGNNITINQTHSPTGTGSITSALTGVTAIGASNITPTLTITGNGITFNQSNQSSAAAAITSSITGIAAGANSINVTTANINYNNITVKQALVSGTYGNANINYISTSGGSTGTLAVYTNLNIGFNNLNTLGGTIRTTPGQVTGINHDFSNVTTLSIASNIIDIDRTGLGITYGTFSSNTAGYNPTNATTSTITANGITFTGSMVGNPTFVLGHQEQEGNASGTIIKNITSDTVNINLPNVNGGTLAGINCQFGLTAAASTNVSSIATCIVSVTGGGLTVYGVQVSGTGIGGFVDINANTFNLSSSNNGPTITGVSINGANRSRIFNNNFNSLAAPNSTTGSPVILGISLTQGGTTIGNPNEIFNNIISNASTFAGSGSATVEGIRITQNVTFANVYKNKIYGFTASTSNAATQVSGIRVNTPSAAGGILNINNNYIGFDNSANPNASNADAVRGINFLTAANTASLNVFHNTIYLAAVPSATTTLYGTTGIYQIGSATLSSLVLRNNIIVNNSTSKGATGRTVVHRRSTAVLTNFNAASNNNLLYAGTPSANNLIYFDGTNADQTLTAYKTRVSTREAASVTENPPFPNTTIGADADYLHIDPTIGTVVESGAGTGTGITSDYDNDTRCPGGGCPGGVGLPDIGADELAGTCPVPAAPTALVLTGSYIGNFTGAVPSPTGGYIVFRTSVNTQPVPVNGTIYTPGTTYTLGVSAFTVSSGVTTTFNNSPGAGTFYYWVFSFNTGCGVSPNYSTAAATSTTDPCPTPLLPSGLVLTPVSSSIISGTFTGSGASGYLVVRTDNATAPSNPLNGNPYIPGQSLGGGTVVYSGPSTSFTATGLAGSSDYWFWIFPYSDGCFGTPTYNTTTPLNLSEFTLPCLVPGTYSVGPTGNFTSIGAVMTALSCFTFAPSVSLTGNYIFEFQPTYVSSGGVETFPIVISPVNNPLAYTITFRPAAGATGRSITSSNTAGTLLFQGIIPSQTPSHFIFDGRPGGVGTAKELTIQNTNIGSSYAIQFENGADTNIIRYCRIRSVHNGTSGGGGTINFASTNSTAGNSNNTLDFNDIYDATGGTPTCAIYSNGSAAPAANNNNTISNNNIYNFFNATYSTAGINLAANSNTWSISGNSFYETAGRTFTSATATFNAILSASNTVGGLTIQNNFIGGTTASAGGGYLTLSGNGILRAIQLTTGTAITSVQNNTITNIAFTSSNSSSTQSLISLVAGVINVGTVTGNTLGSISTTNRITVSLSDNTAGVNFAGISGISSAASDNYQIRNNTIGGIGVSGTSTSGNIQGINFSGATGLYSISANTIGSTTVANSISSALNATVTGILGSSSNPTPIQTIYGNTIANLTATGAGNNTYANGISVSNLGKYDIGNAANGGNTIFNIASNGTNTFNYNASGIVNTATTAGQNIFGNTIYNISSTSAGSDAGVVGIYYNGATGANFVESNNIHSLNLVSSVTNSVMAGIHASSGDATYQNNMVRLGITSTGANITNAYGIYGITEISGVNRFYMNSVYIGGSGVGTGSDSYAFSGDNSGTQDIRNNIFWNARSNNSGTSPSHYAVVLAANTGTIDRNDILVTGTGGVLGYYAFAPQLTLTAWRTATGRDLTSFSSLPGFIAPTAATPSLFINTGVNTVVEASGIAVGPANDIQADTRSALSPVDLGADAFISLSATPIKIDAGITALVAPAAGFGCFTNSEAITVTIRNYSTSTLNFGATPVTITVDITGAVTTTRTLTISSGTLAAGASANYSLSPNLNMTTVGTYTFTASFTVANGVDQDLTNDKFVTNRSTSSLTIGTVSSSPVNFCGVASGTPTLTLNNASGGNIQWFQSSASAAGPWTAVGTNSLSYTPGTAISVRHFYYAEVRCLSSFITSNVVSVDISSPALLTVSADSSSCGPSSFTFTGTVNAGSVLNWYEASTGALAGTGSPFTTPVLSSTTTYNARAVSTTGVPAFATLGTGTAVNITTGYPAPYTNWYGGTKHQILIQASELIAQGGAAGEITSVSFFIQSVGSTFSGALTDFTIYVGTTATNALTSTFLPAPTLVYSAVSQSIPSSGQVTHTFSTPFNWDGFSNIVIQTSFSNNFVGQGTDNVQMYYTPTSFVSTNYYRADNATPAAILGAAAGNGTTPVSPTVNRPNMILGFTAACSSPIVARTATVNPAPTAVSISASNSIITNSTAPTINICTDNAMLVVTGGTTTQNSSVTTNNTTAVAIPDYSGSPSNVASTIGALMPLGATIDSIRVRVNINHTFDADLIINLQSPNGQVVNLINRRGGGGDNFINTQVCSNTADAPLTSGNAPFTGLFRADQATTTGTFPTTTNDFTTLFVGGTGVAQNWILRISDLAGIDVGTLNSWGITIFYKQPVPVPYTWTPITNVYTNAALSAAYTAGSDQDTVYVKPTATTTYTVSATLGTCTVIDTVRVFVNSLSTGATGLSVTPTTGCTGSNITLTQTGGTLGTGATWRWYADAGFTILIGTSAAADASLTIASTGTATYYLRSEGGTAPCAGNVPSASSVTFTASPLNQWLGVNTNWNDPANWCPAVPSVSTNVTVPTVVSGIYPIISAAAECNNLTITGAGNVTVGAAGTLSIAGAITNTGDSIDATAGTINFVGTAAQTLRANHFSSNSIANLTINNTNTVTGVTIDNTGVMLKVTGTVGFGNVNNARLTTSDRLTLISNATATARIGDVTNNALNSGNNIIGKVVVERFIPAKRAWRVLTSPIRSSTVPVPTLSNQWQEGGQSLTLGALSDPNPGYGTHISKGLPIIPASGYDQNNTGNSSILYLTPTGWNGNPTATNGTTIGANNGVITDRPAYMIFVRGDRSTNLGAGTAALLSPTILRNNGLVNVTPADGTPSVVAGSGAYVSGGFTYNVWANPYPSSINYHNLVTSAGNGAVPDQFYLWDANVTGSNSVGGWVSLAWNAGTSSYDRTLLSGPPSVGSYDNSGDIPSGTAFMVRHTGSISFREKNKVSGGNNMLLRPSSLNLHQLRTNLLAKNADGTVSPNDGILVTFSNQNVNSVDNSDMPKLITMAENIAIKSNGSDLAIERRKPVGENDTLQLKISRLKTKNYQLEFALEGMSNASPGISAELEDLFTNTKIQLSFDDTSRYDFSVEVNTPSADANRFRVVFKKLINYTSIKAAVQNEDVLVNWGVASEFNIGEYEVQRSTNGITFETVGTQASVGNSDLSKNYSLLDIKPATGVYYYRVKCIGKNGVTAYSDIAKVKVVKSAPAMFVFPNPVSNNVIGLQMNKMPGGVYETVLLSEDGKALNRSRITHIAGTATETINPKSVLPNGNYRIEVTAPDKKKTVLSIIVQKQ